MILISFLVWQKQALSAETSFFCRKNCYCRKKYFWQKQNICYFRVLVSVSVFLWNFRFGRSLIATRPRTQPLTQPLGLFAIFRGQKWPQRTHSSARQTDQLCILSLFQVISSSFNLLNLAGVAEELPEIEAFVGLLEAALGRRQQVLTQPRAHLKLRQQLC